MTDSKHILIRKWILAILVITLLLPLTQQLLIFLLVPLAIFDGSGLLGLFIIVYASLGVAIVVNVAIVNYLLRNWYYSIGLGIVVGAVSIFLHSIDDQKRQRTIETVNSSLQEQNQIVKNSVKVKDIDFSFHCPNQHATAGHYEQVRFLVTLEVASEGTYEINVSYSSPENHERTFNSSTRRQLTKGKQVVSFTATFGTLYGLFTKSGTSVMEVAVVRHATSGELYGEDTLGSLEDLYPGISPAGQPHETVTRLVTKEKFPLRGISNVYTPSMGKLTCP